jgi:hypothetical protein
MSLTRHLSNRLALPLAFLALGGCDGAGTLPAVAAPFSFSVAATRAAPLPRPVEPKDPAAEFRQAGTDEDLRRAALKKIFSDPHFNAPDPFEAYSGDFTRGEPIPPEMMRTLVQARHLGL